MEVHAAPAVGKRMWSYLRAVFFMVRKGLLSNKRKLLLGVHLLMKRRNRAVSRTVAALLSHHGHHHHGGGGYSNALRRRGEYEFSCSNSPDPASVSASRRHHLAYFPCLGAVAEEEDEDRHRYGGGFPLSDADASPAPLARIEYYAAASPAPSSPGLLLREELAPGGGGNSPAAHRPLCSCWAPEVAGRSPCGCPTTRPMTTTKAPAPAAGGRPWTTRRRSSSAASTSSSAARTPSRCSPTCRSPPPDRSPSWVVAPAV